LAVRDLILDVMRLDRRIRIVVAGTFIAVAARMSLVTFLGIYFVREQAIAVTLVGLAFLAENLSCGLLAPFFGALSDRIGRRPLVLAGLLATAVVLPCFLLVSGPVSLLAWSLALGITGAVRLPAGSALLLDLAPPDRRQTVLAVNYTAMCIGYTVGVAPGGVLAQQGYGLLAVVSGVGYVLVAVVFAIGLRGPLPREAVRSGESLVGRTFAVARDRTFIEFASLALIFPLAMGLYAFVTALFAHDLGLREGMIGLILSANGVLIALFAVPVAARIEPMGPFRLLGLAGAFLAAAFACFAFVPGPVSALLAGALVFTFAELIFSAAVPAAVAHLAPPGARGVYQGAWSLVHSLAMGSALFVSGLLRELVGWRGAWLVFAGLSVAAGLALFGARARFLRAAEARGEVT
jgi:MFS family permease